ncbi:MAG: hypothetical protein WBA29_02680 [Xanthobacteraceae bacterium]
MPVDRHTAARCSANNRSAVSNGSRLLDGIDGRSAQARRFRDLCRSYEAEIGGAVSAVERDMIRQAAALTLRSEQMQAAIVNGEAIDSDQIVRISGAAKRALDSIRAKATKRKAVEPVTDLQAYLASKAEAGAP